MMIVMSLIHQVGEIMKMMVMILWIQMELKIVMGQIVIKMKVKIVTVQYYTSYDEIVNLMGGASR